MVNRFLAPGPAAAALLALSLLGCPCCGGEGKEGPPRPEPLPRPGVQGERAHALLREIVATGARTPGSQAAARTRKILARELAALGLKARSQYFRRPIRGRPVTMVNLWTEIPGPEKGPMVVIGTHYDTKITQGHPDPAHNFTFQGANDSGSGTVILVEMARFLVARKGRAFTYRLVWFDGEESVPFHWDDAQALFGSRHHAAEMERQGLLARVKAMILVDIVGAPGLELDDDTNSSPRLKRLFAATAAELGLPQPLFKEGAYPVIDDHIPFRDKGVPVLVLIGLEQLIDRDIWHTPRDTIDRVSPESLAWVGDLVLQALGKLEKE